MINYVYDLFNYYNILNKISDSDNEFIIITL